MPGFWIYQGSEYASVSEFAKVLNKQGFEYVMVNRVLNMPDYVWLMPGYVDICVNMPKSARMALALYFPISVPSLLERVLTYFSVYTKLEILALRKNKAVPLETQKLIFSIVAAILFDFCFRLNIFTIKISNLVLRLGAEG